ncbi:peptidoglycan-binding domain-containing protein [Roseivivax sp. CAU 1761]
MLQPAFPFPRRGLAALLAAAALAGCAAPAAPPSGAVPEAVADETGRCWATDLVPAIYEQVPGQVQVVQAEIAPDGSVIRPPIYRNAPVPRVVRPRGTLRFEAPCPAARTPDFDASVQRALKVRGYYAGPVNGMVDAATSAAIRRYQRARGLDSGKLSLETARALGLVAVDLPDG